MPLPVKSGPARASAVTDSNVGNAPVRSTLQSGVRMYEHEPDSSEAKLSKIDSAKRLAAYEAVDRHVRPQDKIIGIGSGSTVPFVVERIVAQGAEINKTRQFIPTSFQSKSLIVAANLNLGDVDQFPILDVDIDGADEVDNNLNCIKGGGACQLREKVLAEAAKVFIIVADYRKNSSVLGTSWTHGVPIEVVPFAYAKVLCNLSELQGCTSPKLRMGVAKAGPVVTDNGNFVIDAAFDESSYKNPRDILKRIKMLTGVVEVGLFCDMVETAYFGNADGGITIRHKSGEVKTIDKKDLDSS